MSDDRKKFYDQLYSGMREKARDAKRQAIQLLMAEAITSADFLEKSGDIDAASRLRQAVADVKTAGCDS